MTTVCSENWSYSEFEYQIYHCTVFFDMQTRNRTVKIGWAETNRHERASSQRRVRRRPSCPRRSCQRRRVAGVRQSLRGGRRRSCARPLRADASAARRQRRRRPRPPRPPASDVGAASRQAKPTRQSSLNLTLAADWQQHRRCALAARAHSSRAARMRSAGSRVAARATGAQRMAQERPRGLRRFLL